MDGGSKQEKPPNVNDKLWQKFVELREKREAITKVSTQRRIDRLKEDIIATVARGLSSPSEVKAVLGDVTSTDRSGCSTNEPRKRKWTQGTAEEEGKGTGRRGAKATASASAATTGFAVAAVSSTSAGATAVVTPEIQSQQQQQQKPAQRSSIRSFKPSADVDARWKSIGSFLDPNDRSRGAPLPTTSSASAASRPQSGLEERIEDALASRNYSEAEELSDHLCVRQLGERISKAVDAHEFSQAKMEATRSGQPPRRKKKKLKWGFEPKERWEMKANM